jgi:4'-phosphopantetheinyl transferase
LDQIQINRPIGGKPFLEGAPGYHFSVSHSGDWVLFASARRPVGIDVERIEDFPIEAVDLILAPGEKECLDGMSIRDRVRGFYRYWTLKESYGKALGIGLIEPMARLAIGRDTNGILFISTDNEIDPKARFAVIDLDSSCAASACILQGQPISLKEVSFLRVEDLCESVL